LEKWCKLQKSVKDNLISAHNNPPERPHTGENIVAMTKNKNTNYDSNYENLNKNENEYDSKEFTDDDVDIDEFYEDNQKETITPTTPILTTKTTTTTEIATKSEILDDEYTAIEREDATVSV
jgi:hypothetical protein